MRSARLAKGRATTLTGSMALEILPFADEHLDGAARLLAARHARHRAACPLLPAQYADPRLAREALLAAWRAEGASGAVAVRGATLAGYVVGTPRPDPVWGANVWIESGGHAVEEEPEIVRDLYAAAASRWVEEGRTRHYALVPATDAPLVDAWFRLCFGLQHAHGARRVGRPSEVRAPEGIEIRAPEEGDLEALIDVDLALPQHQRSAPVFSTVPLPTREESRNEWLATFAAGDETLLAAYADGRPVACWAVVPVERSREHRELLRTDGACFLGFASTLPAFRGHGIGVALTQACLRWAAEHGYDVMLTDWRVTNLRASRFWPRRGFRETFLRLYRSIP